MGQSQLAACMPSAVRRFDPSFALLCSNETMRGCPAGVLVGDALIEHALLDRLLRAYAAQPCPEAAGRTSGVTARLRRSGIEEGAIPLMITVLLAGLMPIVRPGRAT